MIGSRPLTDDEIVLMLNSFDNLRDKCLFTLGVKTGFRISEILSVKLADLREYDGIKCYIMVFKSKMKGQGASRSVPINKEVHALLVSYVKTLPQHQIFLFESQKGSMLSRIQAWRIIKLAAIKNKLIGKIATHSMRKTFANKVYNKLHKDLVKTQRALGHVSINSTVAYLSFTDVEIDKAILFMLLLKNFKILLDRFFK